MVEGAEIGAGAGAGVTGRDKEAEALALAAASKAPEGWSALAWGRGGPLLGVAAAEAALSVPAASETILAELAVGADEMEPEASESDGPAEVLGTVARTDSEAILLASALGICLPDGIGRGGGKPTADPLGWVGADAVTAESTAGDAVEFAASVTDLTSPSDESAVVAFGLSSTADCSRGSLTSAG